MVDVNPEIDHFEWLRKSELAYGQLFGLSSKVFIVVESDEPGVAPAEEWAILGRCV